MRETNTNVIVLFKAHVTYRDITQTLITSTNTLTHMVTSQTSLVNRSLEIRYNYNN